MKYRVGFVTNSSSSSSILVSILTDENSYKYYESDWIDEEACERDFNNYENALRSLLAEHRYDSEFLENIFNDDISVDEDSSDQATWDSLHERIHALNISDFDSFLELITKNKLIPNNERLLATRFEWEYQEDSDSDEAKQCYKDGINFVDLRDMKLAFVGVFNREKVELKIKNAGGELTDNIDRDTNFLIVGEKAGSKLNKAKELGIKILNAKDVLGEYDLIGSPREDWSDYYELDGIKFYEIDEV